MSKKVGSFFWSTLHEKNSKLAIFEHGIKDTAHITYSQRVKYRFEHSTLFVLNVTQCVASLPKVDLYLRISIYIFLHKKMFSHPCKMLILQMNDILIFGFSVL